jgi:hypothetical protein
MTVRGHFDGKVVILDEAPPADWQPNMAVEVAAPASQPPAAGNLADDDDQPCQAFMKILESARDMGLPEDFSEQHDHYRLGTPKR